MRALAILFLMAMVLRGFGEDEVIGGKAAHPWAAFQTGSWVRIERSSSSGTTRWGETRTETLVKLEGKEITVRVDVKEKGKPAESKDEKRDIGEPATVSWKEIGKEALMLDGKEVECRILERPLSNPEGWIKSWRGLVEGSDTQLKMVAHTESADGKTSDSAWKLVDLHAKAEVGKEVLVCRLEEVVQEDSDGKSNEKERATGKFWMCPHVPGGLVRWESQSEHGGEETRSTEQVVEFHVERTD